MPPSLLQGDLECVIFPFFVSVWAFLPRKSSQPFTMEGMQTSTNKVEPESPLLPAEKSIHALQPYNWVAKGKNKIVSELCGAIPPNMPIKSKWCFCPWDVQVQSLIHEAKQGRGYYQQTITLRVVLNRGIFELLRLIGRVLKCRCWRSLSRFPEPQRKLTLNLKTVAFQKASCFHQEMWMLILGRQIT